VSTLEEGRSLIDTDVVVFAKGSTGEASIAPHLKERKMNHILNIWTSTDGFRTKFHASLENYNSTISGDYFSVLKKAELINSNITHINRDGNLIAWSKRFV